MGRSNYCLLLLGSKEKQRTEYAAEKHEILSRNFNRAGKAPDLKLTGLSPKVSIS